MLYVQKLAKMSHPSSLLPFNFLQNGSARMMCSLKWNAQTLDLAQKSQQQHVKYYFFIVSSNFMPGIMWGKTQLHSCQLEVWRQPWVHLEGLFSPCCSSNEPTAQVEGLLCYDSHNHYHYNHLYCNDYNYKYVCCNDYNYSNTQPWRFAFSINPAFLSPLVSPTFCR